MKLKILAILIMGLISNTLFSQNSDYDMVVEAVNHYLEGGTNNDFDRLKKAFHENATMKFMGEEGYKEVNALEFFGGVMKPGPKSNRKTFISQINISGNAANARLELIYPDAIIVDYMNLLKFEDGWKIVGKIFDVKSLEKMFPKEE